MFGIRSYTFLRKGRKIHLGCRSEAPDCNLGGHPNQGPGPPALQAALEGNASNLDPYPMGTRPHAAQVLLEVAACWRAATFLASARHLFRQDWLRHPRQGSSLRSITFRNTFRYVPERDSTSGPWMALRERVRGPLFRERTVPLRSWATLQYF